MRGRRHALRQRRPPRPPVPGMAVQKPAVMVAGVERSEADAHTPPIGPGPPRAAGPAPIPHVDDGRDGRPARHRPHLPARGRTTRSPPRTIPARPGVGPEHPAGTVQKNSGSTDDQAMPDRRPPGTTPAAASRTQDTTPPTPRAQLTAIRHPGRHRTGTRTPGRTPRPGPAGRYTPISPSSPTPSASSQHDLGTSSPAHSTNHQDRHSETPNY